MFPEKYLGGTYLAVAAAWVGWVGIVVDATYCMIFVSLLVLVLLYETICHWLDNTTDKGNTLTATTKHASVVQIGTPVMREVVFGDIGINDDIASPDPCGGSVPRAGALVLTFLLNNYRDAEYQELAEQWEKEVGWGHTQQLQSRLRGNMALSQAGWLTFVDQGLSG